MKFLRKIPDAEELKEKYSLSDANKKARACFIDELHKVFDGTSKKKIIVIGPCSADREDAVLDYMERLSGLKEEVSEKLIIVPRIYTSKPRTNGCEYKGLIHRSDPENETDSIYDGIIAIRQMHLHVAEQTGMFGADEMLYPEAHYYISDLLAYSAVGARSVENQQHRLVASGLDMPVGMKNPTCGDNDIMLNAIMSAQNPQTLMYHGYECETSGNPYAHAVLRGYSDLAGAMHSNYHRSDIVNLYDAYCKKNLKHASLIIDCNHCNSGKHYENQPEIAKEVFGYCLGDSLMNGFVKGLMIESYIEDGSQLIADEIYGKSITDSCLGWDKTQRLIRELADII